jgi:hypothetical protein
MQVCKTTEVTLVEQRTSTFFVLVKKLTTHNNENNVLI